MVFHRTLQTTGKSKENAKMQRLPLKPVQKLTSKRERANITPEAGEGIEVEISVESKET